MPAFRLLLASLAVSSLGDWMYNVALLAVVYERTESPTWLAVTTAARILPIVVLGPIGGVIADRFDRRRVIIASDLLCAALMVALAAVVAFDLPVVLAPLVAAAATLASAAHPPAVAASTPRLVDASALQRANATRVAIGQAAIVAGPAIGAGVLAVSSPAVAILVNAATFLVSVALVTAIPAGPAFRPGAEGERAHVLADLRDGVDALRGAPAALRMVAADIVCSAVYGILTVTLVLVAGRVGAGPGGYGLLIGAFGVGGLIGAAVAGRLDGAQWRRTLAIALVLVALPVAALGIAQTLWVALALGLVAGTGAVVAEILSETALPRLVDDEVLARAYGLTLPAALSGIVIGSLIGGPLVALLGLTGALVATGGGVLVLAFLLLRRPLTVAVALPIPSV
ncbi:MAG TPA: MFS transporter [Solirubrobacteraceae bacterium]|nr:MFS transporter [Solirubrobacteraceae bacterium]